jgi:putative aminopeptidase FrvX
MKTSLPIIDSDYLTCVLVDLLKIPSPTGFTEKAIDYIHEELCKNLLTGMEITKKGALIVRITGKKPAAKRVITAHVDTLGGMVKEIKLNGRLKLSQVGWYAWNSIEGEGCTVLTEGNGEVRGSILLTKASAHVHGPEVGETKRTEDTIEVRLDVKTTSAEETRAVGIEVGDFVSLDPRVEVAFGFVRSRHLDDKAGVACLISAIKTMADHKVQPDHTTIFYFSNFEEVGHGINGGFTLEADEFLAIDMAAIGEGQNSDEFHATICVKDSAGPYHQGLSRRLRKLAEENNIAYKTDIYPHYSSDGQAYWRAGGEAAVALIGPGVDASHSYERTHMNALIATTQWILAYVLN